LIVFIKHKLIVFITEMKSVYCTVQTGSLNKAVCALSLKGQYRVCVLIQVLFVLVLWYVRILKFASI
jgi:hypothetical protein